MHIQILINYDFAKFPNNGFCLLVIDKSNVYRKVVLYILNLLSQPAS